MKKNPFSRKLSLPYGAGCDEAGRGCLAGPVVASVVLLPTAYQLPLLNDSKKLTPEQRTRLAILIKQQALAWAIGSATPQEIDQHNILQATFLAMHRAIQDICTQHAISHLLIDGNRFKPYPGIPHTCLVGGDSLVPSIAAASILAKTSRDEYMRCLAQKNQGYGWEKNQGYPTPFHRNAILQLGCTPHHRISFAPCKTARQNSPPLPSKEHP